MVPRGNRIWVGAIVLGLLLNPAQEASAKPTTAAAEARSVTLITGDRVVLGNTGAAQGILPAAGRERMKFSTYTMDDHLYVVPADAARLVATGRLDRRLFDVTTLVDFGYDDAARSTLPLIVTYSQAPLALGNAVALPSINGAAVATEKARAGAFWEAITDGAGSARVASAGVKKVWLDGVRRSSLDRSVPQIGAPAAWQAGFTGTGIKVAVLDTGVDQTHPDLASREIAERNFTDAPSTEDIVGHGTHVASTIAGTGAKYKGVAPGADLLDGKVLDDGGFGAESWIIAGMQWAAEQGAKIVNLSLGGPDAAEVDPIEQAIETLSAQRGTLFVVAAGNSGPGAGTVESPGSADAALTVGAVDHNDAIAPFSSRGPRVGGGIKPDITAPGVAIVAALHSAGTIGSPIEPGYTTLSGTSMATPHVAGAAALLAQQHPDWTGAQLKAALTASARPNPAFSVFEQGTGRVDVARAITQTVISEPTNFDLGVQQWPHDDDEPVTKQLSYRNIGATSSTLRLSVDAKGPDGQPAPAGMFTLSAKEITVPAGGLAEVTVIGNTKIGSVNGLYTGAVVATSGVQSVRTALAIDREVESYQFTLNTLGPDGKPTGDHFTAVAGLDQTLFRGLSDEDGRVTVRLPKGRYIVSGSITSGSSEYLVAYPNLTVTGDTTITMDARAARPINVTPPDPAATFSRAVIGFEMRGRFGFATATSDIGLTFIGQQGPPPGPADKLTAIINTRWIASNGSAYNLAWFPQGVPNGFNRVVGRNEVATVRSEFGASAFAAQGFRWAWPTPATGSISPLPATMTAPQVMPLPGEHIDYYNTQDLNWNYKLIFSGGPHWADFESGPRTYMAGHTHTERFNRGVFGPAFPNTPMSLSGAVREGDKITVSVPLLSDGSGNAGQTDVESASTVLYRNGRKLGDTPVGGWGVFDVPAEPGDYRLTVDAVRPGIFDVSTKVSAAWTFRSGHVDGSANLPLLAVRFLPRLDSNNAAPAGSSLYVPVMVERQPGDQVRPQRLAVDVSYDEGKTWRKADVFVNRAITLHHPATATSVSLRAYATDRDGNTVEQTIIRAYKLTPR